MLTLSRSKIKMKRSCKRLSATITEIKQVYPLQAVIRGISHSRNTFKKTLKVSLKYEMTHLRSNFEAHIAFMRVVGDFCKICFYVLFASLLHYHHGNPLTVGPVKQ